ncbi:4252_t:CDS:2, partial [Dentiscutata erythropus]
SISFPSKQQKKTEALQELIQIHPKLKGKPVYFFSKLDRYFEDILMFDAKEQRTYIYSLINDCKYETFSKWINGLQKRGLFKEQRSALATVFLEPNPTSLSIASILRTSEYILYWKSIASANIEDIFLYMQKKQLLIKAKGILITYEVFVCNQLVKEEYFPFLTKAIKRTYDKVKNFIEYIYNLNICQGQSTKVNSVKTIHASKEILQEKVNQQRKTIKEQTKTIINLKNQLQKKIEKEEEKVSNEIANIVHTVTKSVTNKTTNIANLHPIFQELIRIQCTKLNETRYHPMFLRWAISVYSKSGQTAYNAIKTIMRLLSISTLKKPKRKLATQVHQVIWHSATHNFSFPIFYYGINTMIAHNLNTLIFSLAAKLECLGIHTYGSICDGAGENRTHIKSFD